MCGPVALASFLMYATWFKDMPMGFKIFWMFFTYLLGEVYATQELIFLMVQWHQRFQIIRQTELLSNWRTIGATLAQTAIGVVLPLVVYYTDEGEIQYYPVRK